MKNALQNLRSLFFAVKINKTQITDILGHKLKTYPKKAQKWVTFKNYNPK